MPTPHTFFSDRKPRLGFIGAGRLATTLAMAWTQAGEVLGGVASRRQSSAIGLIEHCPGASVALALDTPQSVADVSDIVFITVPDSSIREVVERVAWHPGQYVVHCSAATEVSILEKAATDGASIGGFHPLQLFADPCVAIGHLKGSTVAIEASGNLYDELVRLSGTLGLKPIALPKGARAAYHVAGNLAASCLLAVLKEAEDVWTQCGLPPEAALSALMPLSLGTLAAAQQSGIAKAIAGPISRGDIEVVAHHMEALVGQDRDPRLYQELLTRLITMAGSTKRIDEKTAAALSKALEQTKR
jgi:predicted short-subunit dehydrogenase-like oxidoreductase (DUF2520 family)